ncbi:unnamed protein product [Ophioblennius macclurei]
MSSYTLLQTDSSRVMTFNPSRDEFKDFGRYIAYMESQGAHRAGMARVIPPKGWKPRSRYDNLDDLVISAPIQQVVTGQSGLFTQYNIQKKPMTLHEFQKTSTLDKFCSPRILDFEELERKFWKNLTFNPPLYGANVSGTLYDPDVTEWNMSHLNTILDMVEKESSVTTPYLDFGMWKSAFAWHTKDMDLYSINYVHFGEPKCWYAVPPEHGKRLERLAKGFFPGNAQSCEAFLRHKMTLISPSILKKYGIPFDKVTQEAGQFIVTFPFCYHAGFNHGFNCAESTNFATQRWIDYGKQATQCSCRQDMAKISMDIFVRKFQPDRYKLWKAGKDMTSIDHSKPMPEAMEFLNGAGTDTSRDIYVDQNDPQILQDHQIHQDIKDLEEVESHKPRLSQKKSRTRGSCKQVGETVRVKLSSKKDTKPQSKPPQPRTNSKKTSNKWSPSKKDRKSMLAEDLSLPEETVLSEEPPPPQKVFQRTLSPTDVLHVHSYAKGDYGDGDVPDGKEESDGLQTANSPSFPRQGTEEEPGNGEQESHLGQLPGCHPLMKEEDPSDEGEEEPPDQAFALQQDGLQGELWAKPLAHLWQNKPPNLKKEREYNRRVGSKPPYCSICSLFFSHQAECADPPVMVSGWMRTKPLIPEMCFASTTEEDSRQHQPVTAELEDDGTSMLVSCSRCSVRVHASCYGVDSSSVNQEWKCARCQANAMSEACCLCSLRGGALQKANNNKWVHVLCAVAVLEARFVNVSERSPVDLSGIPLQRFKLKCYYCKKRLKKASGCCVQCSHGRCPTAYHPTCAQAAGVLMQPDEWPFMVHVTCCRHKGPTPIERNKAAMHELTVGQKVICKHKNGRYYQCDVVQLSKETFYEVNFDDGSFSDNLFPEDIVSRDCAQLGPPPQGEVVQVRWTDGLVYGAKFVSAHIIQMYLVEFEDGSQLTAKRDDVYSLDEELPKRVKSRLSKASDMRFDGIFEEREIIQDSKRQRVINSRYRGDYIEPVIYRAIME